MKHFVNGIEVTPRNLRELGFKTNIERWNEVEINNSRIVLPSDGREAVLNYLAQYGWGHAIPYTIIQDGIILEYQINPLEDLRIRETDVECTIERRRGKGSFFERASGMTFEQFTAEGVNYVTLDGKYIIIKDNILEQSLTLYLGIFTTSIALAQAIRDIANLVADVQSAIGVDPSDATAAIIKLAAQVVYLVGLLIAFIRLVAEFKELVFPKVRSVKVTRVAELISRSCAHLGYGYQSTLLNQLNKLTVMPVPFRREKKSMFDFKIDLYNDALTKGYPTANDTTPTLKLLIEAVEEQFNAECRVVNGVVRIETKQFWQTLAQEALTSGVNLQDIRENEYVLNTEDLWCRYYINYLTDISDIHTIDRNQDTYYERGAEVMTKAAQDLSVLKGLRDVSIPFALGTRKESLTFIEKLVKSLFDVVDAIANVFGWQINTSAFIGDRLGVTIVSNQHWNRTKILWMNADGRQPNNYLNFIGAKSLWNNYHDIEQPFTNGYKIYRGVPIPVTDENLQNIIDVNFVTLNGTNVELLEWVWIPEESKIIADVKLPTTDLGINIKTFEI